MTPNYANMFMDNFEQNVLREYFFKKWIIFFGMVLIDSGELKTLRDIGGRVLFTWHNNLQNIKKLYQILDSFI